MLKNLTVALMTALFLVSTPGCADPARNSSADRVVEAGKPPAPTPTPVEVPSESQVREAFQKLKDAKLVVTSKSCRACFLARYSNYENYEDGETWELLKTHAVYVIYKDSRGPDYGWSIGIPLFEKRGTYSLENGVLHYYYKGYLYIQGAGKFEAETKFQAKPLETGGYLVSIYSDSPAGEFNYEFELQPSQPQK